MNGWQVCFTQSETRGCQAMGAGGKTVRSEPLALIEVVSEKPTTLRRTLAHIRQRGHSVSLVMRMQEACARRDLLAPDIVLLDARHHLIDTAQVCSQLCRGEEGVGDVLVVLDSGQKHHRNWFVTLGAADCVASGDDPEEIGLRMQVLLARHSKKKPVRPAREHVPSPLVSAICDYLSRHLAEPVGMEDLEQRFGAARRQLNHQFELEMGRTIFAWYRQRKLDYAKELLGNSMLGIQEIARILGYASVCNFSTAFRQHLGCSPRYYRQTLMNSSKSLKTG